MKQHVFWFYFFSYFISVIVMFYIAASISIILYITWWKIVSLIFSRVYKDNNIVFPIIEMRRNIFRIDLICIENYDYLYISIELVIVCIFFFRWSKTKLKDLIKCHLVHIFHISDLIIPLINWNSIWLNIQTFCRDIFVRFVCHSVPSNLTYRRLTT